MDRDALLQGIEIAARRARWTRGLLVAIVLATLACIAVELSLLDFVRRAQAGETVTEAEGEAIDGQRFLVACLWILIRLLALIAWMMWLHRATANLRLAGSGRSRFSPGWAVGWHFVPIMNLFRVWQVTQDLAGRSAEGNERPIGPKSDSVLVSAWWLLFLFSHFVDCYVGRVVEKAETLGQMARASRLSLFTWVILAITAVLAWLVVRHIDRLQREVLVLAPPVPGPAPEAATPG